MHIEGNEHEWRSPRWLIALILSAIAIAFGFVRPETRLVPDDRRGLPTLTPGLAN